MATDGATLIKYKQTLLLLLMYSQQNQGYKQMAVVDRVRKVDIEKLEDSQVEAVATQLGDKVKEICDKACEDANLLLKIYGLQAKMEIVLEPLSSN